MLLLGQCFFQSQHQQSIAPLMHFWLQVCSRPLQTGLWLFLWSWPSQFAAAAVTGVTDVVVLELSL
jgi:hypothetical protein